MEKLVTLATPKKRTYKFPLQLTDEYYDRTSENEALHTHVTSLCIVQVGERILCIDKRIKDKMRGRTVPSDLTLSLDLAGCGHGTRKPGMVQYSYDDALNDAAKELAEEISIDGKALSVDRNRLKFIDFVKYSSENNLELSCLWMYAIEQSDNSSIKCMDSVYKDGVETNFELPFYLFTTQQLKNLFFFSKKSSTVAIQDGIGRLLRAKRGDLSTYLGGSNDKA